MVSPQAIASGLATRGAVEALASKPYIGPSAVRAYLANAIGAAAPLPLHSNTSSALLQQRPCCAETEQACVQGLGG